MNETKAPTLTPAERSDLRARAHHLKPVVMIGEAGLTDAVLAEADTALRAHQLVKIRVLGDERAARASLMDGICAALACAPVQSIGKLLVVYRPADDDEAGDAGSKSRKRSGPHRPKKALGARAETTASKPRSAARPVPPAVSPAKRGAISGGIKMTPVSKKSLSEKTAGKRTDLASTVKPPARKGAPKKSTQGPVHLQGSTAPRTTGRRDRAKSGS